jgi:flagellar motility protein MotE (MotC chaperone)
MKKIHIILLVVAGILSFASAFGVSFVIKKNKAAKAAAEAAAKVEKPGETKTDQGASEPGVITNLLEEAQISDEMGLSETQLKSLIFDVRQKMEDYKNKEKTLEQEKQQVDITRKTMQDEIERLTQLQEKLNITLTAIKDKEDALKKSILEIDTMERANLQRIATTYDKMDSAQAGKILVTMVTNKQMPDAVKIMYYMSERSSAKVLGEIGSSAPEVAAALSLQLKRVKENK